MAEWNRHTPNGVCDILADECAAKKEIESTIWNVFASMGYREVELPTFEYYDVFANSGGQISQENMFKFFDERGRILTLRPDITTSIARMAATKEDLSVLPKRYCYTGNVFRAEETQGARQREFTQAGIELIGAYSPEADAEVIAAAIEAVIAVGIDEFSMEIGQVTFFNGLVEQAGLSAEQTEKLRERIDSKDTLGIREMVSRLDIGNDIKKLLSELPSLFGTAEVLDRADVEGLNATSKAALDNIRRIYELLTLYGLEKFISIDLGMLQSIDYYTGTIFKCYTHGVGFPICAGGRYDNLVGHFGVNVGAVGAAFGINRMMTALRSKGTAAHSLPSVSVVFAEKNAEGIAYDLAYTLRLNGCLIEGYIGGGDYKECEEYCKRINAGSMMRVHADGLLQIKDFIRGDITETTAEEFLGFYEDDCDCGEHHHDHDCDCGHCH
ncbi:MAG: ATP phosphoribosyltransferase regulatory subunit [Clostridia bacterium]|nr:ATP phosphoribosyltransferase regulatory subunit [Clostridia bacterium]